MKTVYVVTSGWYSDYRIDAIFEDRRQAERHRAQRSDANDVETWTLYETGDPDPQQVVIYGAAAEWFRNTSDEIREWSFTQWDYENEFGLGKRKRVVVKEGDAPAGHYIRAWSFNAELARKAVADRRAMYLARLEGVA